MRHRVHCVYVHVHSMSCNTCKRLKFEYKTRFTLYVALVFAPSSRVFWCRYVLLHCVTKPGPFAFIALLAFALFGRRFVLVPAALFFLILSAHANFITAARVLPSHRTLPFRIFVCVTSALHKIILIPCRLLCLFLALFFIRPRSVSFARRAHDHDKKCHDHGKTNPHDMSTLHSIRPEKYSFVVHLRKTGEFFSTRPLRLRKHAEAGVVRIFDVFRRLGVVCARVGFRFATVRRK